MFRWPINPYLPKLRIKRTFVTIPDFHVTISEFHVTIPDFPVIISEFNVTVSEFHVKIPDFHVTTSEFHVTIPDFHAIQARYVTDFGHSEIATCTALVLVLRVTADSELLGQIPSTRWSVCSSPCQSNT